MCLNAQPVGNTGGYSYLYLVKNNKKQRTKEKTLWELQVNRQGNLEE